MGASMQAKEFIQQMEDQAVIAAIREAESCTSGEIRVVVSSRSSVDPRNDAFAAFARLGMNQTAERNGVLIFLAPVSRNFAIVGDMGIHRCSGEVFWQDAADDLGKGLHEGRFTDALATVIRTLGVQLAVHFPRRPDDRNELADEVAKD